MKTIIIHEISQREIEDCDINPFVSRFGSLTNFTSDEILGLCDSLVLSVRGYDIDVRELYLIPEVRAYFKEQIRWWPYWLYAGKVDADSFGVPLLCLMESLDSVTVDGRSEVSAHFDIKEMSNVLLELFPWMNQLCDKVDLGDNYIERRTTAILRRLFGKECSL